MLSGIWKRIARRHTEDAYAEELQAINLTRADLRGRSDEDLPSLAKRPNLPRAAAFALACEAARRTIGLDPFDVQVIPGRDGPAGRKPSAAAARPGEGPSTPPAPPRRANVPALWQDSVTVSMRWAIAIGGAFTVFACLGVALGSGDGPEARVTLDVKEAGIQDVARALLQASGLQVLFDPDVSCQLTIKVHEARWLTALRASLNACALGYEEEGNVVRIATRARLTAEAVERRRLAEERRLAPANRVERFRLSYARAREMAALLEKALSGRGQVVYDERTNTLIILE